MTPNVDEHLKQNFLDGMSRIAATVNIVTTNGESGKAGTTATAMSSVSTDSPGPTLLICINKGASTAPLIPNHKAFCVNVLNDAQSLEANAFANLLTDQFDSKFDCGDWVTTETGQLRLSDALVCFDCDLVDQKEVGTHFVFFGRVRQVFLGKNGSSLLYSNRSYSSSTPL